MRECYVDKDGVVHCGNCDEPHVNDFELVTIGGVQYRVCPWCNTTYPVMSIPDGN